jgi:hypothetical protein
LALALRGGGNPLTEVPLIAEGNVPCNGFMQFEGAHWELPRVGSMRENQLSKRMDEISSRSVPHGSPPLPIFAEEMDDAAERTDPLASDGPFLASSEWPTSSELENALLEADPFPTSENSLSLAGDIGDLFGGFEPPLGRDTLPSPPPAAEDREPPKSAAHLSRSRQAG